MSTPNPGTSLSVTTDRLWSLGLYYQLLNGRLEESRRVDDEWIRDAHLSVSPVDGTPLASVTYEDGREFRVYYIDTNSIIQECCYSRGVGVWYRGEIGQLKAKASPTAGLAATLHSAGDKGFHHIRVYYQEPETGIIAELVNDGQWHSGDLSIPDALSGTNLAVVSYYFQDQTQIRVYYQARDLSLKEYGRNKNGWFEGDFNTGKVTTRTSIGGVAFGDIQLQVYYRDFEGRVVFVKNTGAWGDASVIKGIGPGHNFAVVESSSRFRLFYQESTGVIIELYSDDAGHTWFPGKLRVGEQTRP